MNEIFYVQTKNIKIRYGLDKSNIVSFIETNFKIFTKCKKIDKYHFTCLNFYDIDLNEYNCYMYFDLHFEDINDNIYQTLKECKDAMLLEKL
jgi:hypothetical protein